MQRYRKVVGQNDMTLLYFSFLFGGALCVKACMGSRAVLERNIAIPKREHLDVVLQDANL